MISAITQPSKWGDAELRRSLIYEPDHMRCRDWTIQLVAHMIGFHPLVWIALRRLCLDAELACDEAVIQKEGAEYAAQLVSLARRMSKAQPPRVLGIANRRDLSKRVSTLLDGTQRRGRTRLLAAAAIVIGAALVVFTIAPLQVVAQSPATHESRRALTEGRSDDPSALTRALYEAAEAGDISSMQRLARLGADLNGKLPVDGSPLIVAARKGQLAAVRWLLDHGADPNMPVRGDGNPLIMAAREGHIDVMRLLLERGASINQIVPGDENALIQASGSGHLDAVKLLVSCGADVNIRVWVDGPRGQNGEWRSPLSMARKNGHSEVVAYLLSIRAHE